MPTYKDDFTEFYLNLRSLIGSDITSDERPVVPCRCLYADENG